MGHKVIKVYNFTTRNQLLLKYVLYITVFNTFEGDILDLLKLAEGIRVVDCVIYLAANHEVRFEIKLGTWIRTQLQPIKF